MRRVSSCLCLENSADEVFISCIFLFFVLLFIQGGKVQLVGRLR